VNADEMSVYKKCTDVSEMLRRLGDIHFHTHTEVMPTADIFLCTNYYVFKKIPNIFGSKCFRIV
jgi:hypothetical protein